MPRVKAILLCLATLYAPVALSQSANPAVPGTVNYVEGSASIEGRVLNQRSVGFAYLKPGQVLETADGRVELLLTPGVFLRVGDHGAVRLISPNLLNTQVEVDPRPSRYRSRMRSTRVTTCKSRKPAPIRAC